MNLKWQLPNRCLDILEVVFYKIGIDADINSKVARRLIMQHTLINKSNMSMYMNDMVNANICSRNVDGEVFLDKTIIPSIIDSSILLTVNITCK